MEMTTVENAQNVSHPYTSKMGKTAIQIKEPVHKNKIFSIHVLTHEVGI
jgi:hypothetical protein